MLFLAAKLTWPEVKKGGTFWFLIFLITLHSTFFTEEICINFLPLAIHVYLHVILYVWKLVKRSKIQIKVFLFTILLSLIRPCGREYSQINMRVNRWQPLSKIDRCVQDQHSFLSFIEFTLYFWWNTQQPRQISPNWKSVYQRSSPCKLSKQQTTWNSKMINEL